jgi:hypothetical protein
MRCSITYLAFVALLGCAGDDGRGRSSPLASTTADAAPQHGTVACGDDSCDVATELCMECNCGGPTRFTCVPVPDGCELDRSCACVSDELCPATESGGGCDDVAADVIFCETGLE